MKLKILTQNCFGVPLPGTRGRMQEIAKKIFEVSPDVVFLQEIQWKSFVEEFKNSSYELAFDDGFYATRGGLLTLVKNEHKLDFRFVKFQKQGGVRQIADRALGKGILDVVLPRVKLHLINTHFLATYLPGRFKDGAQEKQLKQFLEYVKPIDRFVGAGDLNFPEGSDYYDQLISGVTDFSFGMGNSHGIMRAKIDFVFGKGNFEVLKKEFVDYDAFVSDHKGILVDVEI